MRRSSRAVRIGDVIVGGGAPPVIQSMTSTPTQDARATVDQALCLSKRGAAMVRVAIPDNRALSALPEIRAMMDAAKARFPLIGDIHFSLRLALESMQHVEKIRLNPGNLLDQPRGRGATGADGVGTEKAAAEALQSVFAEAKRRQRAVRVGVNQGSLSLRIVAEYGIGANALVASAMEYTRVAHSSSFGDLVISLKSSNPWTVVAAHRALADEDVEAPFHVGVTEAGWGMQGRARSAAGIGILLRDGLVDTMRVSLAEPPERELPVAAALVAASRPLLVPGVQIRDRTVQGVQIYRDRNQGPPVRTQIRTRVRSADTESSVVNSDGKITHLFDLCRPDTPVPQDCNAVRIVGRPASPHELADLIDGSLLSRAQYQRIRVVQLPLPGNEPGGEERLTELLAGLESEIVWEADIADEPTALLACVDLAQLFEAGCLDYVELRTGAGANDDYERSVDILQGIGTGSWCLEVIACPQCGRCRIDVPALASHLRKTLGHFAGLKLAIMGCIVNGPGEMQDADLGCIGEGKDTVSIYRGGKLVERGVNAWTAGERLQELASALWSSPS